MKISESKLREIIKQELTSLNEGEYTSEVSGELSKLNYKMSHYYKQIGEVGWAMHQAGYSERERENMHKEFGKVRDLHNKIVKRLSRKLDK